MAISTGVVRIKRGERGMRRYLPGGWRDTTLPVHVFVLPHPHGMCVFDAGQTTEAAKRGHFPAWHPFFRLARFELEPGDELRARLKQLGLVEPDVRWLVLSHLHTDHAGGLADLRPAEVLVSREEWRRARGLRGRLRGYLPGHWPAGLVPHLVDFDRDPVGPFRASVDLAGDGRLRLVHTPGHTPGHMAMIASVGRQRFLLAGDLCPTAEALRDVDPALDAFCRRHGITVLATHDPAVPELLAVA